MPIMRKMNLIKVHFWTYLTNWAMNEATFRDPAVWYDFQALH